MKRERFKWRPHKNLSTDTGHRDGPERSSEETSVMGVERRHPDYPVFEIGQPVMGGVFGESKVVCDPQAGSLERV
jgi:RNA-directed DNA polymerase